MKMFRKIKSLLVSTLSCAVVTGGSVSAFYPTENEWTQILSKSMQAVVAVNNSWNYSNGIDDDTVRKDITTLANVLNRKYGIGINRCKAIARFYLAKMYLLMIFDYDVVHQFEDRIKTSNNEEVVLSSIVNKITEEWEFLLDCDDAKCIVIAIFGLAC